MRIIFSPTVSAMKSDLLVFVFKLTIGISPSRQNEFVFVILGNFHYAVKVIGIVDTLKQDWCLMD